MSLFSLLPILIIVSGSYLLIKLKFFFIKHPIRTLKFAFSGKNKKKSILSLLLALAGTLGVGNISGVAIGIAAGGAGSVFWLIVSALFSSAIKYAEVYISYHSGGTGMLSVIRSSFKYTGNLFACLYAFLAVILSLSMGSVFQARAISEALDNTPSNNIYIFAFCISIFIATVCLLGKEKIKNAVALIIPIAMIVYTGMCLSVIFSNYDKLPCVIHQIFASAFSIRGAAGGILGFVVSSGMKEGFARGLLSNEAGAGTSSFSHTSHIESNTQASKKQNANNLSPQSLSENSENRKNDTLSFLETERAGIFGILEVIFDTLLLCPLTAFSILLGCDGKKFGGSLSELSKIFENHAGSIAPNLLLYSIIFFAVSTVLCWYYYGSVSLFYITRGKGKAIYSIFFFASFFTAVIKEVPHTLFITDTALFLMSVISLSAVIKNRALLRFEETL
ncbi:MAG: hypothetical protein E7673_04060 [Ruminococcaceae bacterium]|nr:hypothetical protein [Oscillospiraceae bacterium]